MNDKPVLEMKNISKSFPGTKALHQVDFSVNEGEVHCLIGANGAGKSTLMKILVGVYQYDEGEIHLRDKQVRYSSPLQSRDAGISIIHQELSLVEPLSIAENIFLGTYTGPVVNWNLLFRKAAMLLESIGVPLDPNLPVSELSMGHKQIVELAKALATDAKIIVMDEPSATLSEYEFETLKKVINDLRNRGISVIYISHKLEELFDIGDRVTVLRDGKLVATKRLSELTMNELVELIVGHVHSKHTVATSQVEKSESLLEIKNASTGRLKNVSFTLHKGEILGLYGLVGAGRTEVLRCLFGVDSFKGEIRVREKVVRFKSPYDAIQHGLALVPENRKTEGLILDAAIWENIALPSLHKWSRYGVVLKKFLLRPITKVMKDVHVKAAGEQGTVGNLSGGNQQKVVLAKWLLRGSNVLLLDEPTQGIDINAKEEIYKLIGEVAQVGNSVIIASSEKDELLRLCNRVLVMYHGRIVFESLNPSEDEKEILHASVAGR